MAFVANDFCVKGQADQVDYFAAMSAFVRSVELGSFSKAAEEAGVKVSTVSRYVSGLEKDLGAALLNRSTRRLHLTEAGKAFYSRATQIVGDVEEARQATRALNGQPQGLLKINIPSAFGRLHVMPYLKDFLDVYPDIRIDAMLTDQTVDLIDTGSDIAIRIGALKDSSLIARRLAGQHRCLVASKAYLEAHPPLTLPEHLIAHRCLAFALQPSDAWFSRPKSAPKDPPTAVSINTYLRANDSEALLGLALDDLGIALLPNWLVSEEVCSGRLVALLTDWEWLIAPGPTRAIWAVYPPKRIVSPKVRAFVDFLAERLGEKIDQQMSP